MSGRLEFTIVGDPVKELSPNVLARLHWAEKGRRVKKWQRVAWVCWLHAGGIRFADPVRVCFLVRRSRRVDIDNAAASMKACLDGLKGVNGMVLDDNQKCVRDVLTRLECGPEWKGCEEVVVVVEACDG